LITQRRVNQERASRALLELAREKTGARGRRPFAATNCRRWPGPSIGRLRPRSTSSPGTPPPRLCFRDPGATRGGWAPPQVSLSERKPAPRLASSSSTLSGDAAIPRLHCVSAGPRSEVRKVRRRFGLTPNHYGSRGCRSPGQRIIDRLGRRVGSDAGGESLPILPRRSKLCAANSKRGRRLARRRRASPMRRGAAVAASVASGAAAWVVLAESWGQPVPAYGRPGGGVRPDHPTSSVPHVAIAPDKSWASSLFGSLPSSRATRTSRPRSRWSPPRAYESPMF
jgi:hypothetical protein